MDYAKIADLVKKAYTTRTDLGTTEYLLDSFEYDGITWQAILIPGTDELLDWPKNLDLHSLDGMKRASVEAAKEIRCDLLGKIDYERPVIVAGHSKGGATALCYHKMYDTDFCISFCPARCFTDETHLENCVVFIDKDDPVPKLGSLHFRLPECPTIELPDDHIGLKVSDHFMDHIIEFIKDM